MAFRCTRFGFPRETVMVGFQDESWRPLKASRGSNRMFVPPSKSEAASFQATQLPSISIRSPQLGSSRDCWRKAFTSRNKTASLVRAVKTVQQGGVYKSHGVRVKRCSSERRSNQVQMQKKLCMSRRDGSAQPLFSKDEFARGKRHGAQVKLCSTTYEVCSN